MGPTLRGDVLPRRMPNTVAAAQYALVIFETLQLRPRGACHPQTLACYGMWGDGGPQPGVKPATTAGWWRRSLPPDESRTGRHASVGCTAANVVAADPAR